MAIVVQTVRTYALDGSTKDFIVPFEYLARKFVQVSLLGTAGRKQLVLNSEFRFSTKNQVTLLQAWGPANGYDRVELRRHTSATERLVDFTDGSILRATDLNISQIQAIHIAEEARDAALLALPQDDDGNLDAKNRRIVNLAPAINAKDAVNKQQLDETLGEAGGVLSDVKDTQEEIYEYIEKFSTDTALVKGVSWVYNNGSANGGESVIRIDKATKVFAVPYIEVNGSRQEVGYHFEFDGTTQTITLAKPLEAGDFLMAMTTESHLPLEDLLSNSTGAASIGKAGGGTVQDGLDASDHGTDVLKDSANKGHMDTLLVANTPGVKNLNGHSYMMPHGTFTAKRVLRTRGLPKEDPMYTKFALRGQGSSFTKLVADTTGVGDIVFVDYLRDVFMGGFMMDNTPLGSGTSSQDTRNGQMWIRHSEDSQFDDLRFAGADALSFCLDHCKNIVATDMKVDYQLRYPVGTGKSPLIVGDYSEQCMFIGGYVKSVSPDGKYKYSGDLADNDQADDTKWAFINLYGLKYTDKPNSNACMWQEGQHDPSNAHFIGMNYINNGVGHGVSEKAMGTDLGSTFRGAQVRAIWNRAEYASIGGHFLDNKGEYPAGTGGAGAAATGGIHNDNAKFTASIGDYFRGNVADYMDYTGASQQNPENSTHIVGSKLSSLIRTSSSSTSQHLSLTNCQLAMGAKFSGGGNGRLHVSVNGCHIVGPIGQFGHGQSETLMDISGSTFTAGGYTNEVITQSGVGNISFVKSTFRDYAKLVAGSATRVTFESCTFFSVTFVENDLKARYVNCKFVNCTNAPDTKGINFMADSTNRPASARTTVQLAAGSTYTFPAWVMQNRGVYTVSVGGNGQNTKTAIGVVGKSSAGGTGTWTPQWESNPGSITVSWPKDGQIQVKVTDAGNYSIAIH